ncbi:RING finger domain-containing protein [Trichophyton equinum CBS 127.97]|uniref:RING finger domain-containing protein n=1 Tax=Trichophyton equinum (strain ATCC MYA-4606 / CBS 127.97) TaxID=559882 RepID=F2PH22_TRIEC|nr:RING finger domain-containing protein [Trichophyton equinum CBS 127.97]
MTTPSPSSTPGASGESGSNNSPLLFFVALGFGVVFTNLWIIVGVKYCFRYNQRHRQARNDDNGDPIDMVNVPRTHRRRREKKLMSMEDVNSRFPITKYKSWRASRAEAGLPTAGGIDSNIDTHTNQQAGHQESGTIDTSRTTTSADRGECSGAMSPDSMLGRKSTDIQVPPAAHGDHLSNCPHATVASRMVLAGRFMPMLPGEENNRSARDRGLRVAGDHAGQDGTQPQSNGWRSRLPRLNIPFGRNRNNGSQQGDANASSVVADPPTPRQLESASHVAR